MEEYYRNYFEGQPELNGKTGNRILCVTTVVMIGIQFLMIFMGIYDTLPLVLGTQLSVLLIPIIGALISGVDVKETFKLRPISFKMVVFSFFDYSLLLSHRGSVELSFYAFCGKRGGGNGSRTLQSWFYRVDAGNGRVSGHR